MIGTGKKLMCAQHAVDVEATVRNGALDVGIFAPTSMVSLEEGERLLEDMRDVLGDV
jgi:hypothetical protein